MALGPRNFQVYHYDGVAFLKGPNLAPDSENDNIIVYTH